MKIDIVNKYFPHRLINIFILLNIFFFGMFVYMDKYKLSVIPLLTGGLFIYFSVRFSIEYEQEK